MARRPKKTPLVRLNKYIADSGVTSRRKADELIDAGKITVNGRKVFELGVKIDPSQDQVRLSGKLIEPNQPRVYVAFNKPKNVVTSMKDPEGRRCVADYFQDIPFRLFPVGRLDWDSEGLLLLTNDGDFAHKVTHPSGEITKTYLAKIDGHPTPEKLEKLRRGVSIIGGRVHAKRVERVPKADTKYAWIRIVVTEGKNRQVRRMFEKIGYDVMKLQREAIGQLRLGKTKKGEYRTLTDRSLEKIFLPDLELKPHQKRSHGSKKKRRSSRGPARK